MKSKEIKKGVIFGEMVVQDMYGNLWRTPIFGDLDKKEKYIMEQSFKKHIFNRLKSL